MVFTKHMQPSFTKNAVVFQLLCYAKLRCWSHWMSYFIPKYDVCIFNFFITYFVVLDDVWSTYTWKRISCALPNSAIGKSGRILIMTRAKNVAESCCIHPNDVHQSSGFAKDDSKKLFDSRIYVSGNYSRHDDSEEILEMSGGIPLAIVVTAGLLSWKAPSVLPAPSVLRMLKALGNAEGITKVLGMSYVDLPLTVKSCFLYLCAFPANHAIKKDRLIRRWIAEGFVPESSTMWQVANSYFDELISRRLIQPVFDDWVDDQPIGCTVPTVVLDFIVCLLARENFITTGEELSAQVSRCGWIR